LSPKHWLFMAKRTPSTPSRSDILFGEEHLHYLATLGNLVVAYAKTARFTAAEALFLEARNTYKKVFFFDGNCNHQNDIG